MAYFEQLKQSRDTLLFRQEMGHIDQNWKWTLALGVILTVAGIWAFGLPVHSTLAFTMALATLLIVVGATGLVHAFRLRQRRGSGARFLLAFGALIAGAVMMRYPDVGAAT